MQRSAIASLLQPMGGGARVFRLPELESVRLTPTLADVVDHPHFQRLRRVRQLGPTLFVYPGAVHTRFEHSIGVCHQAGRYLAALLQRPSVADSLGEADVHAALAAALLHDVGHYPFAHTLEAIHHKDRGVDTPRHEDLVRSILFGRAPGLPRASDTIAQRLSAGGIDAERVASLIDADASTLSTVDRLLQSVISSTIDADKMDYLWRDSVHLGVPYGRHHDRERLLNALTVSRDGDAIAVTRKGIVSAELFLMCRYTMFSEVYWHHTVRAVSAMLELAIGDLVARDRPDLADLTSRLLSVSDDALLETVFAESPPKSLTYRALSGLVGDRRRIYKRVATWSASYPDARARDGYARLLALSPDETAALLTTLRHTLSPTARPIPDGSLILDIPPRDKDKVPDLDVQLHGDTYATLAETSRLAHAISADFAKITKKIRLFVHPDVAEKLGGVDAADAVWEALDS